MQPTFPPPPGMPAPPSLPPVPVLPPVRRPVRPDTARWLLWGILTVFVLAIAGGGAAPRTGLSVHIFDALLPPSPAFLWWLVFVAALLTFPLIFSSRLRVWFGPGFLIRPLRFPVPGALALVAGGLLALSAAALLDGIWHAGHGVSVTMWSLPVALGAWAVLAIVLGLVACRLALIPLKPLRWYSAMLLGWLVLNLSFVPVTGPLGANSAPVLLVAARYVSGLLADPATQHVYRIYLGANLTRTNPFFLPLAAFWAGSGLALVRAFDRRAWVFLATAALWSVLAFFTAIGDVRQLDHFLNTDLARDPRTWAIVPLLPAAILFAILSWLGVSERAAWALAGLLFGILTLGVWGSGPVYLVMALLASVILPLGADGGARVARTLAEPTAGRVRAFLLAAALIPLAFGCLDLLLRLTIS